MPNESKQFSVVFVLRISVVNDPRIVTRFETYVFTAPTTDDAYQQACEYGPRLDYGYRNTDGEVVTIECLGINDLDEVEPGTEDYPGLVSSAQFVTPDGLESSALITKKDALTGDSRDSDHSGFPNLNQ